MESPKTPQTNGGAVHGGTKNDSAPQESVGSQASARSSNVNPQSEHWKSILVESYSNIKCDTFEKGVRKKEVKKSLYSQEKSFAVLLSA